MPRDRLLPKDVILGEFVKMDLMKEHPKCEELRDMLNKDRGGWIDLEDPCVVLEGLPHLPILTHGSFMDERGNILRLAPKEPRGVPKGGLRAVTNGDGGGRIEKVEVLLVTRVSQLDPHLGRLLPFVSRPPQPEGACKLVGVEDPKSPIFEWPANSLPVYFAFCPCRFVCSRP